MLLSSSDTARTSSSSSSSLELESSLPQANSSSTSSLSPSLPWTASTSLRAGAPPNQVLWHRYDALLEAAVEGNVPQLLKCLQKRTTPRYLHSVRTLTGLTILHCAVWSGHLPAVQCLLEHDDAGLYVDITDWHGGTPLWTLLTKPGKARIYERAPEKRQAMMDYLLQQGANPYFPWKTIAPDEEKDHKDIQEWLQKARQASPYKALFQQYQARVLQGDTTTPVSPSESSKKSDQGDSQLEDYLQLQWKSRTATWFVCYHRAETMRCFHPHTPQGHCPSLEQVERLAQECHHDHHSWRKSYVAPSIVQHDPSQQESRPQVVQSKTIHTLLPSTHATPLPAVVTEAIASSSPRETPERKLLKKTSSAAASAKLYKPRPENLSERYKAALMQRPKLPQDIILRNVVLASTASSAKGDATSSEKKDPSSDPNETIQKALSHLDEPSTSLIQCLLSNNHAFSKFRTHETATGVVADQL